MAKRPNRSTKEKRADPLICLCNGIALSEIKDAIRRGAKSTDEIGDLTTAGIGACGGSCRPQLKKILEEAKAIKTKFETQD